jgi:membrane protein YdbS with pleckstrin-like domain
MRAQRVWKPVGPVKKNAEIERLRLDLAGVNERIEELEERRSEASKDRDTEGKRAHAGASD